MIAPLGRMLHTYGHARLLDEAEWAPDMEGVELIPGPGLCLECRRPLRAELTRFCDVVCEAGFYVETRS